MTFPIFTADRTVRIPLVWNGTYTMNEANGTAGDIVEIDGFSVRDVYAANIEPYTEWNGFEAYRIHHNSKIIRITGTIRKATHLEALNEFELLAGAFNPHVIYTEDQINSGFAELTWTDDVGDHIYIARPLATPDLSHNIYQSANVPFTVDLLAKPFHGVDFVTDEVTSVTSGGAEHISVVNGGTAIGYPVIKMDLTALNHVDNWKITNAQDPTNASIQLDLALQTGELVIDTLNREVIVDGAPGDSMFDSARFFGLHPGTNDLVITPNNPDGVHWDITIERYEKYMSK